MTAAEVIAAIQAEGVAMSATERGTVRCVPSPSPELRAALVLHKVAVLAILRSGSPDEWEMPSPEAMEAARRARREALYSPPVINSAAPGLGRQFKNEMERLASLGLVVLKGED